MSELESLLCDTQVLKHPYYQAWNSGELPKESLKTYARQYFKHVDAFPRYLSSTHSKTTDIRARQLLLENLIDEERGEENHPELWLRFSEGLGNSREATQSEVALPETNDLVKCFMELASSSSEEGLGALYAYEHQVPKVAETKIKGLKMFYGIDDSRSLSFFEVHQKADEYHTAALCELIEGMTREQQSRLKQGAYKASEALWNFLTGICRETGISFENCEMKATEVPQAVDA